MVGLQLGAHVGSNSLSGLSIGSSYAAPLPDATTPSPTFALSTKGAEKFDMEVSIIVGKEDGGAVTEEGPILVSLPLEWRWRF